MTQTPSIHLTEPTIGGDTGVWPAALNTDMLLIDRAVNGTVTVSVPDTNVTLTADGTTSDQTLYQVYNFTGALTANRTITLPANYKIGYAINATTGGFNIILSAGGTTLALVPGSARVRFEVDGSNNASSPATAQGAFLRAASGYVTLSGGVIRQWTSALTDGSGNWTVNWPVTFPTTVASYHVTQAAAGGRPIFVPQVVAVTTTTINGYARDLISPNGFATAVTVLVSGEGW